MATAPLADVEWWMGLIVGFAVGHFFLFCNVFRVGKPLELTWSAIFVALSGSTIVTGRPGWLVTVAVTLAATPVVIVAQVRSPSYHGIAWQRLNPKLREWWETRGAGRGARCAMSLHSIMAFSGRPC
ncbi:MAG: hypothetical protein WAO95_02005 [Burkholderiales bacterium]